MKKQTAFNNMNMYLEVIMEFMGKPCHKRDYTIITNSMPINSKDLFKINNNFDPAVYIVNEEYLPNNIKSIVFGYFTNEIKIKLCSKKNTNFYRNKIKDVKGIISNFSDSRIEVKHGIKIFDGPINVLTMGYGPNIHLYPFVLPSESCKHERTLIIPPYCNEIIDYLCESEK